MPTERHQPMATEIGILRGREAIFLDKLQFEESRLTLEGSFNAAAIDPGASNWFTYRLTFEGVLAAQILELDSWCDQGLSSKQISSFDEVLHSRWFRRLGGKVTPSHRHYSLVSYDYALEVVCTGFQLVVERER